jgi:hypothetical protein
VRLNSFLLIFLLCIFAGPRHIDHPLFFITGIPELLFYLYVLASVAPRQSSARDRLPPRSKVFFLGAAQIEIITHNHLTLYYPMFLLHHNCDNGKDRSWPP